MVTRAPTAANRMHLAASFLEAVTAKYGGQRLGRQELDGELVLDVEGALWTWAMLEAAQAPRELELDRIVVAVDPPVTSGKATRTSAASSSPASRGPRSRGRTGSAEVIADGSLQGASPQAWAERAVELYHAHQADRLVAEVNQGGDLVATLIQGVDRMVPFRGVRATRGKVVRAEPVAALYEQGRICHRAAFPELEAQMAAMTVDGFAGPGQPGPGGCAGLGDHRADDRAGVAAHRSPRVRAAC